MDSIHIGLFIPGGDPKGLRTAEIKGWTGWAIAAPRTEFELLTKREELERSGVYVLLGTDPESGRPQAYVGEAEVVRDRLKQHRGREFWVSVIVFVSKDENLTKAHIRYLEGKLIEEARAVGRALVENGVSSGARLPEADRADMQQFLARIRQLLPVLGSDLLTPIASGESLPNRERVLYCRRNDVEAMGQRTPNGFVVFKGSQAILEDRPALERNSPSIVAQRKQMRADGTLCPKGETLEFQRDVEFTSPSAAALVVFGSNANGLIEWRDISGRTLKGIEDSAGQT